MRKYSSDLAFDTPDTFSKTAFSKITLSRILEARRIFLSSQLSEVCRETANPKILSVANGAVREAESAIELCRVARGTFVVLDGSGQPPDLFRPDYHDRCARYVTYPHGAMPSRENIGDFDYVYALNLLNELDQRRARAIIAGMLSLVRPGGRLLVSNFTSEFTSIALGGFHRREEELANLVPDSREHELLGHAIWRDESRAILYLEIQKTGELNKTGEAGKLDLVSRGGAPRPGFLHQEHQWRE